MYDLYMAGIKVQHKEMRKLVVSLKDAGLEVSTTSKNHLRVFNPATNTVVFVSAHSLTDRRAIKNILGDLKRVGYNPNKKEQNA